MINKKSKEIRLEGLAISSGVAYAKSCLMNNDSNQKQKFREISLAEVPGQIVRLEEAIQQIKNKLERLIPSITKKVGKNEANIFTALKMMILDPELQKKMFQTIEKEVCSAEKAVDMVFVKYEKMLSSASDEYIRERASDLSDLKRHLLKELGIETNTLKCEGLADCNKSHERIIVASELTPSLTATFDLYQTRGFVSEIGGTTSHAAILARGMGVPAVSNVVGATAKIFCDSDVLIDGDKGLVFINPSATTLAQYSNINQIAEPTISNPVNGLRVLANISQVSDAELANKYGAEGIGLFRTEIEFIVQNSHLTEDDQFRHYSQIIKKMPGKIFCFRMLDIGGDKPLSFVNIPAEDNPALGLRGARFLIHFKEFFINQARALARASKLAPISVMYPMVSSLKQFVKLKKLFQEAVADLDCGTIQHGVLFEIPAACLMADSILEVADFGSIGTNDLIQYLMAVDRSNALVANEYDLDSPALWAVMKIIAEAAIKNDKPLSVCGELASQTDFLARFIKLGINTLSVDPHAISKVRARAQEILN